ncbi:MAG TPA: 23S rRNA (adenine(2030)-N(6))-methyltransferase RlmJ [Alphaproteobacteria bacterium]|nr:23S rRNA (adenine(2030)-N(6))-methyltransferase RlmJ [Alphaproteobacteria bacterium]
MNYRHAYHAGNFADVLKHAALAALLVHLRAKDKPFRVVDTHAGIGRYDLSGIEAQKTGEFRDGVLRVLEAGLPALEPYLAEIRALNPEGGVTVYPGSPLLTRRLLRPFDRLTCCELHPEDAATLKALFARDRQVQVRHEDGYAALKGLLPPPERRGLVLIDPPFEQRDEFDRMAAALIAAWTRWPTGIFAGWYPIKDPADGWRLHEALAAAGLRRVLALELMRRHADNPLRLNGTGLVIINPPWQFDLTFSEVLSRLAEIFADANGAEGKVSWIVPE